MVGGGTGQRKRPRGVALRCHPGVLAPNPRPRLWRPAGVYPSVVILRGVDLRPEASGERLLQVLVAAAEVLEAGAIVVVDSRRIRVRPLPLG